MIRKRRDNRRYMAWLKAYRKKRIAKEVCYDEENHPFYDNLHQYSKNKIHCSCPDCSPKTRNKGRRNRRNYMKSLNYKIADLRRQIAMDLDEQENTGACKSRSNNTNHKIPNG